MSAQELSQVSEVTIQYKPKFKAIDRPKIIGSGMEAKLFRVMYDEADDIEYCESCYIMLLNRRNRCIGIKKISTGSAVGTIMCPTMIFQTALKANAQCIILCHNHPSGELEPSGQDLSHTRTIKDGGKLLQITVLDHLILSADGFYSFADNGQI